MSAVKVHGVNVRFTPIPGILQRITIRGAIQMSGNAIESNLEAKEVKSKTKVSNVMIQSLAYDIMNGGEKFTVNEIHQLVNQRLNSGGNSPTTERTVRRALEELKTKGFCQTYGRKNNALLFAKVSASFAQSGENEPTVVFAGELVTVETFLRILSDEDENPLKIKNEMLTDRMSHMIRRRMLYVVLSAGATGQKEKLDKIHKELTILLNELEHIQRVIKTFVDSTIWYDQYRDRAAYELRSVREHHAELVQLATDYMKSEG